MPPEKSQKTAPVAKDRLGPGGRVERHGFAGLFIHGSRDAELLAVDGWHMGDQVNGVDGDLVRVRQQPSDVEDAFFVFQRCFLAVEDERPRATALAQRVPGADRLRVEG
jgi:hypothetical protein